MKTTSSPKGNDRSPENKQVFLNSSLVSKRFLQLVKGSQLCSKNQNLKSIKGRNPFANLRKTMIYITDVDLVNDNQYTKLSLILSIRSQDIE